MPTNHSRCENCHNATPEAILIAAFTELGHALCKSCQANFKMKLENSTWEAISLYLSLKKKGIPATLENFQEEQVTPGQARVDISIRQEQPNPGNLHETGKEGHHSYRKGLLTVHVPTTLVTADEETAGYITRFLNSNNYSQGL